jgi:hypothetical protein
MRNSFVLPLPTIQEMNTLSYRIAEGSNINDDKNNDNNNNNNKHKCKCDSLHAKERSLKFLPAIYWSFEMKVCNSVVLVCIFCSLDKAEWSVRYLLS